MSRKTSNKPTLEIGWWSTWGLALIGGILLVMSIGAVIGICIGAADIPAVTSH